MKNKEIKISIAVPDDLMGIQEVFNKTWLDTYPNEELGISLHDIEDRLKDSFTEKALSKRREQITNPPKGHSLFIAKEGEKTVGVCNAVKSDEHNRIQAIYVLPKYQGRGIGMMLWNEALKFFDPNKDILVALATYNKKAIKFYKKLGFVDTGKRFTEEWTKMKSGSIIPEMEMIKTV